MIVLSGVLWVFPLAGQLPHDIGAHVDGKTDIIVGILNERGMADDAVGGIAERRNCKGCMMESANPRFIGAFLFVSDLQASIRFYRMLGLEIEVVGEALARASWTNGVVLALGTAELTQSYDPGWSPPNGLTTNTINFEFESREAVDEVYSRMTEAGFEGRLAPFDPPWEARFALLNDPDGNIIGLHSPRDLEADRARERAVAH